MASISLDEFAITNNAFLPESCPIKCLPDDYYQPWETIAQDLPHLIKSRLLRSAVADLPVLSTDHLQSEAEWRRAYSLLAFLSHAYVWGGDKPEEILPPQLAIPFLSASSHVEIPPVLTCAAVNLWNYSLEGSDLSNPDHLSTLLTFTGTESESWFLRIGIAVEAKGAGIIKQLVKAFEGVGTKRYAAITRALVDLKASIQEIVGLLERMHEKCDPLTFCHQIRPFYAGSRNVEGAGLPKGVFYDEGDGKGKWWKLPGGSNGQSSLLQLFDIVLGVGHNGHPSRKHEGFHYDTRQCTPGPHRRFLDHVSQLGSIRELALLPPTSKKQRRLRIAYSSAAEALTQFRAKHIQIVTRFVAMQLKKPWEGSQQSQTLPKLMPSGLHDSAPNGTTGTALLYFLRKMRDETAVAGILST